MFTKASAHCFVDSILPVCENSEKEAMVNSSSSLNARKRAPWMFYVQKRLT